MPGYELHSVSGQNKPRISRISRSFRFGDLGPDPFSDFDNQVKSVSRRNSKESILPLFSYQGQENIGSFLTKIGAHDITAPGA